VGVALSGIILELCSSCAAVSWCRTSRTAQVLRESPGLRRKRRKLRGQHSKTRRGYGGDLAGGCRLTQVGRPTLSRSASGVHLGRLVVPLADWMPASRTPTSTARNSLPRRLTPTRSSNDTTAIRSLDNLAAPGSASFISLQASAPPDDSSTAARQTFGLRPLRTWTSAFEVCNMATLPLRHPRDRASSCPLNKEIHVTRHKRMKSLGSLDSVNGLSLDLELSSSRTRHFQDHFIN
jgi:hypothetical protein